MNNAKAIKLIPVHIDDVNCQYFVNEEELITVKGCEGRLIETAPLKTGTWVNIKILSTTCPEVDRNTMLNTGVARAVITRLYIRAFGKMVAKQINLPLLPTRTGICNILATDSELEIYVDSNTDKTFAGIETNGCPAAFRLCLNVYARLNKQTGEVTCDALFRHRKLVSYQGHYTQADEAALAHIEVVGYDLEAELDV